MAAEHDGNLSTRVEPGIHDAGMTACSRDESDNSASGPNCDARRTDLFGRVRSGGGSAVPVGNFSSGVATEFTDPSGNPPGTDLWSCRPSASHPNPVILVHGTLANENFSWQELSPMLANAGYCAYAFNYGADASTAGHFYGLADIVRSAGQLATFTDKVLAATGAAQVDLVGHSQGGMMPRYYIQFLGGAPHVHMLVGLAPPIRGPRWTAWAGWLRCSATSSYRC
jgi:pimeloyl-ACP methyl ester carboxylesterase